ncbi:MULTISPECIES: HGGxSTG domain-containing protein [unclassified Aeromicrobium]|uniref:HGGxSTG domain-containing protein n=1 Tax=unclassified Aeromicrobium TaxID=2633570 RepID=UPI000B2C7FA0|nr:MULTISPECIES: HGGxSTG domain-containing protein [unclassified Aeromicrobium]
MTDPREPSSNPMRFGADEAPHASRCEAKTRSGSQCGSWAMRGQRRCRMHGGSSPQARKAGERRLATRAAVAELNAVLAHEGLKPIEDPYNEMALLASEARAFQAACAQRVNALNAIRYEASGAGTEQTRAEVALYERSMDRAGKFLDVLMRSGFEERRVRVTEEQARQMALIIQEILGRLGLDARQAALVPVVAPEVLRKYSGQSELRAIQGGA